MRVIDESKLTEEEIIELERLSALSYKLSEIALFFDFDEKSFKEYAEDENSLIHRHLKRGRLIVKANASMQLLSSAESGNITAIQQLSKFLKEKKYEDLLDSLGKDEI